MVYFCRECWNKIDESTAVCPECGADQRVLGEEPFVRKLIRALRHPEPATPIRAAYVLGMLQASEAVQELIRVMNGSPDPYIAAACALALGEIGGGTAVQALQEVLSRQASLPLRTAAEHALERLPSDTLRQG